MEKQDEIMQKQLDKINNNLELIYENIDQTNEKMDRLKEATQSVEWSIGCLWRMCLIIILLIICL